MIEKLKPCPFCGNEAGIEHEEQEVPTGEDWYRVICQHCGGNSGWYMTPGEAMFVWNSRV